MRRSVKLLTRSAHALVASTVLIAAVGEASERYDTSRHAQYAAHQLRERRRRLRSPSPPTPSTDADSDPAAPEPPLDSGASWLHRETPTFPYLLSLSPADDPAQAAQSVLGATDGFIGSGKEATAESITALMRPEASIDIALHAMGTTWQSLKSRLNAGVPSAFDPRRSAMQRRLDDLLTALTASASDADGETTHSNQKDALVFYLRDGDTWDDATASQWLEWIHHVTTQGLAHVVLPTAVAITLSAIARWQRLHKVADAEFVAILLRVATDHTDHRQSPTDKLAVLCDQYGLNLRGVVPSDHNQDGEETLANALESTRIPTEVSVIVERVGNWWSDLDAVCVELAARGFQSITSDEERLVLVTEVCDEMEHGVIQQILDTLALYHEAEDDSRLSALQAWKCMQVATSVGASESVLASAQEFLMPSTDGKPLNCVHPVDALLPFNQRPHGEAMFMELIDRRLLHLRPKAGLEIGIVPCDAKMLVAPCWVETRPLVQRAFATLWRDDGHYRRVLELERFEDNHKMTEEIALFASEIQHQQQLLDAQTREFIFMQKLMKPQGIAQRKAELALLELAIASKKVYLARLRDLLD